jgi:hypothetical protein
MPLNIPEIMNARAKKDGLSPAWDMTNLTFLRISEETAELNRIGATYLSDPSPDVSKYWRIMKTVYYDLKPVMWTGNAERGKKTESGKTIRIGGRAFFEVLKKQIDEFVMTYYEDKAAGFESYPPVELIQALDTFHEQLLEEKQRCGLGIKTKRKRRLYDRFESDVTIPL